MSISVLDTIWHELYLMISSKMLIWTTYTLDQVIQFVGIADRVEDFLMKSQQNGKNWSI